MAADALPPAPATSRTPGSSRGSSRRAPASRRRRRSAGEQRPLQRVRERARRPARRPARRDPARGRDGGAPVRIACWSRASDAVRSEPASRLPPRRSVAMWSAASPAPPRASASHSSAASASARRPAAGSARRRAPGRRAPAWRPDTSAGATAWAAGPCSSCVGQVDDEADQSWRWSATAGSRSGCAARIAVPAGGRQGQPGLAGGRLERDIGHRNANGIMALAILRRNRDD